jgi:dGTPase
MEWDKLLSHNRLCRPNAVPQEGRSPFQQDIDRITFSAAFRRLAYKTQVHPLSPNDHVHTRLTHSIEVASVGRSLGTGVGAEIAKPPTITQDTFGYVVQAACLAHDIGNPPFGHFGEYAIRSWFKKNTEPGSKLAVRLGDSRKEDFTLFDGNAQGFRIITQLENDKWAGGLQLTYAVLGTFTKYPRASNIQKRNYIGAQKPGFFKSEEGYFYDVANQLGLDQPEHEDPYWCRHPLAFLVEAADDICYKIIDIEDGYELGYLSFVEAKDILASIACNDPYLTTLPALESDQIGKLRAVAVGLSVKECIRVFVENQAGILAGSFNHSLIDLTRFSEQLKHASKVAR